jgi:putative addiction module CopG family antidote
MSIQLPDDLHQFIRAMVQNGRFASEEEVIAAALRLLKAEEDRRSATGLGILEVSWSAGVPFLDRLRGQQS